MGFNNDKFSTNKANKIRNFDLGFGLQIILIQPKNSSKNLSKVINSLR